MKNKYINKADGTKELYLYGDVLSDWEAELQDFCGVTGGVSTKTVREVLQDAPDAELTIHINSDGGDVSAGIAIANLIRSRAGKTVGVVDGWAASIASVIFMACDELHMPENTFLMVHKPSAHVGYGNAADLRAYADTLDAMQEGIEKTYQARAAEGVTADDIHQDVEAETWYTAEEAAKKYAISVDPLQAQMVACSTRDFAHAPLAVKALKAELAAPKTEEKTEQVQNFDEEKAYISAVLKKGELLR